MKNVYVWKLVIASEKVCHSLKMVLVAIFCHKILSNCKSIGLYTNRVIIASKNLAIK